MVSLIQFNYCLISFLVFSQIALASKRNPDEFKTIDTSRKIIKKIENCKYDVRNSLTKIEENETPIINSPDEIVCGETTFMQITRLNENKIGDIDVQRNAMSAAFKAIQQFSDFIDIANYIEQNLPEPAKGKWLCIVGRAANFDTSLKQKVSEYLDFTISLVKIQLFNIETSCLSERSEKPISPKLNSKSVARVKSNSLSVEKKKDSINYIKNALKEYSNVEDGINYVCPYVTNELEINYGLSKWTCVAGAKDSYVFTHTIEKTPSLKVEFDDVLVEIVEVSSNPTRATTACPSEKSKSNNQEEIIFAARNAFNQVSINETRMDNQMKKNVLQIVFNVVATEPTYDALSKKLQDRLNYSYGTYWAAVVGSDLDYWTYFYVLNPFFINLKIDRLRIIVYKQMKYCS